MTSTEGDGSESDRGLSPRPRVLWKVGLGLAGGLLGGCALLADLAQFDNYDTSEAGADGPPVDEAGESAADAADAAGDAAGDVVADGDVGADILAADVDAAADGRTSDGLADADAAEAAGDTGTVDADGSVNPCVATPPNLIANPGFECGLAGWSTLGNATIQIVNGMAHSGTSSCLASQRLEAFDGPTQLLQAQFTGGLSYTASAWVTVGLTDGGAVDQTAKLTAYYNCISGDAGQQYKNIVTGTAVPGTWTQLAGTLTIPTGCSGFVSSGIYVEGPPPGIDLYVDDVSLTQP
jgi:hypothetical protein